VYQLSWTFGQTVAPLLLTVLLDRGASLPWLFLTVLALLAVPALLLLERMTGVETGAIDGDETAARAGGVRPEPVG
jgi:ABC-type branched-subunit amino acid transport system permease subunit